MNKKNIGPTMVHKCSVSFESNIGLIHAFVQSNSPKDAINIYGLPARALVNNKKQRLLGLCSELYMIAMAHGIGIMYPLSSM